MLACAPAPLAYPRAAARGTPPARPAGLRCWLAAALLAAAAIYRFASCRRPAAAATIAAVLLALAAYSMGGASGLVVSAIARAAPVPRGLARAAAPG